MSKKVTAIDWYNNDVLKSYLISQGYLQAEVTGDTITRGKKGKAIYTANTGIRYKINSIAFPSDTGILTNNINANKSKTLLTNSKKKSIKSRA